MRILFLFALLMALCSPVVHAQTQETTVFPQELAVHKTFDAQAELTVSVRNDTVSALIYEVRAPEFSQLIKVWPVQFRLAPAESQDVAVAVGHVPAGDRTTSLTVVSREIGSPVGTSKESINVPISLSIAKPAGTPSRWLMPLCVALLLAALSGLCASMVRRKRQSAALRIIDAADESASAASWQTWIAHAWRMHRLTIVSVVCVVIASGLLVASLVVDPMPSEQSASQQEQAYAVRLRTPDAERVYEIEAEAGEQVTAFSALQKLSERYTISLEYDPPTEMGVFVRRIDGLVNGTDNLYWVYEINGQQVPVAADKSFLKPGDDLLWKFTNPL